MSNIDVRYIIIEVPFNVFGTFIVKDQKEDRVMCACHNRKDAGLIAGTLNKAYEAIEQDMIAGELGG